MCGIVGYVGDRDCADVLVDALSSWNIEVMTRQELPCLKKVRLRLKNAKAVLPI